MFYEADANDITKLGNEQGRSSLIGNSIEDFYARNVLGLHISDVEKEKASVLFFVNWFFCNHRMPPNSLQTT
jgi:hypothetical protein